MAKWDYRGFWQNWISSHWIQKLYRNFTSYTLSNFSERTVPGNRQWVIAKKLLDDESNGISLWKLQFKFELEGIWPGKSRHYTCVGEGHCPVRTVQYALCEGGGLPAACTRLWLVVLIRERWILSNRITATGWSHRQWIFTWQTYFLFYCQIIITILANITKKP